MLEYSRVTWYTDKTVNVPATTVAKFKVGKALKDTVANAK